MKTIDREKDEIGKRLLAPLRDAPPMDPTTRAIEKAKFLSQADKLRQEFPLEPRLARDQKRRGFFSIFQGTNTTYFFKAMAVTLIVLVILLGSSFTVFAAQNSLPGEPLYPVKSLSEDIRLSLTTSTQEKLDLILAYTNRRASEISQLAANGKTLPTQTSERYQSELDNVLQLAAEMNDTQMRSALGQIKSQAESQGMSLGELISRLPPQAEPAITHLQERLQQQIELSSIGENDPQTFRSEVHKRQHGHPASSEMTPAPSQPNQAPTEGSSLSQPTNNAGDEGNGNPKSTEPAGHGGPGSEQGNPSPGNGKHTPEPTPVP